MKLSTPLEIALVARAARAVKDNLAQRSVLKYLHVNRMTRTRECQYSEIHGTKWRIGVVKSQRSRRRHESVVMCLSWTEEFCLTSTCLLHVLWRAYTRRLWYKHLSAHVYGVCVCVCGTLWGGIELGLGQSTERCSMLEKWARCCGNDFCTV